MSWTGSFVRAFASALYWWGIGWLLYLVTSGDPLPLGQQRSMLQDYGPVTLIVVGAIIVNALLMRFDGGRR